MRLSFDSIDEVREFVKALKGTRGGKDKEDGAETPGTPPAPMQPPAGNAQGFPGAPGGFAAPAAGAAIGGGFPAVGALQTVDPAVTALVGRVSGAIDGAIKTGQPADAVLAWFRSQCGPDAAAATIDQIKTVHLPKMTVPALENIAKLVNA